MINEIIKSIALTLLELEEFVQSDMGKKFCRLDMPSGQTFLVRVEA